MESTKKLLLNGVIWNAIQMVVNQSFSFVIRLVLAKMLFPEQFGIIGMAAVFTGFVQILTDLGIGAALIQKPEEQLRKAHFDTAFWTGILWSIFLYVVMAFAVAPFAAIFYKEPILNNLIPVICLGILIGPINMINKTQLTKSMNFKKIAFIDNSSNIAAGLISLLLAYFGAGVWSLAFNSVASLLFALPFYIKSTGWTPSFVWEQSAFKDVFGFGISATGTNIVNYLIDNVDYLLIGKLLSAPALGAYTLSFVLTDTFRSRLMAVMNNVMYPVYGRNQNDPVALKKYYLKIVQYNSVIIYPIMLFFIVFGEDLVISVFGSKWIESVVPLKILSGSVMIHMLVNSNTVLIRGLGKPGLEFKLQAFKAIIFVPILALGIYRYGIVGAAWAVLVNKALAVIIAQFTFNYLLNIKISIKDFANCVKVPILVSVFVYILSSGLLLVTNNFLIGLIFIMGLYFSCVWLLMKDELKHQFVNFRKSK